MGLRLVVFSLCFLLHLTKGRRLAVLFFIPGCLFPGFQEPLSPGQIAFALLCWALKMIILHFLEGILSLPQWLFQSTFCHTTDENVLLSSVLSSLLSLLQCTVITHNTCLMRMGKWKFKSQSCASCGHHTDVLDPAHLGRELTQEKVSECIRA